MKLQKVVILALKDEKGNFYACNQYIEKGHPPLITRLYMEHPVEVAIVEIFPYTNFTSFSTYDEEVYSFTYLHALVEMSDEEFQNLSAGDIRKYQFYRRKVQAVEELKTPFAYTWEIYEKELQKELESKSSNIRYGALSWQVLMGFNSDAEFDIYQRFFNLPNKCYNPYDFKVSKFNWKYLERVLLLRYPINIHYVLNEGIFSIDKDFLIALVDKMSLPAFAHFHNGEYLSYLGKASSERINKDLFDEILKQTGNSVTEYISRMPENVIKEYGPDYLFNIAFQEMDAMLQSSEYEPYTYYLDDDYEFFGTHDDRDREVDIILNLLPHLTEDSIPLLNELVYERIEEFLTDEIKLKMQK